MNMVFEGLKQKGSMIIVPSTAVETMGLGAIGGLTAFDRIQSEGIKNIVAILGKSDDPGLPEGQIDIVLIVHVFHIVIQEQDPLALLENIRTSLKPDGLLVLVQWNGKKMGYPDVYAYSEESVLKVIEKSCFELVHVETFLPRDNIYVLRAK